MSNQIANLYNYGFKLLSTVRMHATQNIADTDTELKQGNPVVKTNYCILVHGGMCSK